MRKILILLMLLTFFSCSKKEPSIVWEKSTVFSEILASADDGYVMIAFVRDG